MSHSQAIMGLMTSRSVLPAIAFDIYGTIVDPSDMVNNLAKSFGSQAKQAAQLWRDKQIEFTFRRALMRKYVDFDKCTAQALTYVCEQMSVSIKNDEKSALLDAYLQLPAFPDVKPAFDALRRSGYRLLALSNGTESSLRAVLQNSDLLRYFEAVLSVDHIHTFKPDPAVYEYLVQSVKRPKEEVWLVSSNPWDVIGAKACGLKTAWAHRDSARIFDPWEFSPDIVVSNLEILKDEISKVH